MVLGQRWIWAICMLLILPEASAKPATNLYHPSTLPSGLNITESGSRNLSGIDWDSILPPFVNFLNHTNPELERPDRDVFSFSPENIASSNLHTWYAAWTRAWSTHPMWEAKGETGLWTFQFLDIDDYFCDISMTHCPHEPDRNHIQKIWPGLENRAIAQRVYLHQYMLSQHHNIKRQQLDVITNLHGYFSNVAFDIVKTFTKQVDAAKVRKCDIIHKVVDLAVQVSVSMAAGAAGALSTALTAENSLLSFLSSPNVLDGKLFSNAGIQFKDGVLSLVEKGDWSDAAKFNWFAVLQNQFFSTMSDFAQENTRTIFTSKLEDGKNITEPGKPRLDPGMAADAMCSAFEGDRKDLNDANTHQLNNIMGNFFSGLRGHLQACFSKNYNGWVPEMGMPSMMAIDFAMRDWAPLHGPDSMHSPLKDPARYERDMTSKVLRYFLSRIMGDDNIYLYCMHVSNAKEQCNTVLKKNDHQWYKDYRNTQICPRPDTDPTLICSAARWYHASTMQSHVSLMPGIDKIESWNSDRFHLNVKELLQESFETYLKYRNDLDKIDWMSGGVNESVFGLPTCVGDDLRLYDGNPNFGLPIWKNPSYLQFPFRCGDWRVNESAGFMKAMNLEPGSRYHSQIEGITGTLHPNELFEDRIPRLLDERNTSAVSHYRTLCANGIRLPERKDKKGDSWTLNQFRVHTEVDQDCELVSTAIDNMTEFEANRWFCENRGNHTIFERQQERYMLPQTLWRFDSHKKRCDDWLEDLHKREKKAKAKAKESRKSNPCRRS